MKLQQPPLIKHVFPLICSFQNAVLLQIFEAERMKGSKSEPWPRILQQQKWIFNGKLMFSTLLVNQTILENPPFSIGKCICHAGPFFRHPSLDGRFPGFLVSLAISSWPLTAPSLLSWWGPWFWRAFSACEPGSGMGGSWLVLGYTCKYGPKFGLIFFYLVENIGF